MLIAFLTILLGKDILIATFQFDISYTIFYDQRFLNGTWNDPIG